jgi:hypothetical protein
MYFYIEENPRVGAGIEKILHLKFMTANVQYLFDMRKLLKRPMPDQGEFEARNYELLKAFVNATYLGYKQTLNDREGKPPLSMNFSWFANTMNGNVLSEMAKLFPNNVKATGRKNYSVMLKPNYECYIKKLARKNLMPSYNHSITTAAMCEQMALPSHQALPVIFIGYTLSDDNDQLMGCYAVCIKGKERMWVSDLTLLQPPSTGDGFNLTPILPDLSPQPQVAVKVKPAKKAN